MIYDDQFILIQAARYGSNFRLQG